MRGGRGCARDGVEVVSCNAAWVGGALCAAHGVDGVEDALMDISWALVLLEVVRCSLLSRSWWCALSVAALAPQGFVCWRGWGRTTPVAVVDIVFHMFIELLKQECALQAHLLYAAVQAEDAEACAVVRLFNVIDAPAEVDAFAVISGFNGWWEIFL